MGLKLTPLHPVFVAEASGLDLTRPLARAEACAINAAINTFGVLVWRSPAHRRPWTWPGARR